MRLTKRMHEVLKAADIAAGEIHDVPMSTMYGLESREIVSSGWRRGQGTFICRTGGGAFPAFSHVQFVRLSTFFWGGRLDPVQIHRLDLDYASLREQLGRLLRLRQRPDVVPALWVIGCPFQ
jgi:hypothetical protein